MHANVQNTGKALNCHANVTIKNIGQFQANAMDHRRDSIAKQAQNKFPRPVSWLTTRLAPLFQNLFARSPAYSNGHDAYYAERTVANPHAAGTTDYQDWERGYQDASGKAW